MYVAKFQKKKNLKSNELLTKKGEKFFSFLQLDLAGLFITALGTNIVLTNLGFEPEIIGPLTLGVGLIGGVATYAGTSVLIKKLKQKLEIEL